MGRSSKGVRLFCVGTEFGGGAESWIHLLCLKKLLVWEGKQQEGRVEYPFHKDSALKKVQINWYFFLFILWSWAGKLLNEDKKNSADSAVRLVTIDI